MVPNHARYHLRYTPKQLFHYNDLVWKSQALFPRPGKKKTAGNNPRRFVIRQANCSGRRTPQSLAMDREKKPRFFRQELTSSL